MIISFQFTSWTWTFFIFSYCQVLPCFHSRSVPADFFHRSPAEPSRSRSWGATAPSWRRHLERPTASQRPLMWAVSQMIKSDQREIIWNIMKYLNLMIKQSMSRWVLIILFDTGRYPKPLHVSIQLGEVKAPEAWSDFLSLAASTHV